METKIGAVLSGGSARGIAHLGILKALEEFGIVPSFTSGASAGAIAIDFLCSWLSYTRNCKHFKGKTNF